MVASIAAFLVSALGLVWLYLGWQQRSSKSLKNWLPAWLLIAASVWLWGVAHGWEFGVCYALITLALQAWLLIVLKRQPAREQRHERQPNDIPIAWLAVIRSLPRQLVTFLLAVPLAGTASVFATVMLTSLLPWHDVNLMAFGIYLMPLLWGVAAYWACADRKPWRPTVVLSVIIVAESLTIYGV